MNSMSSQRGGAGEPGNVSQTAGGTNKPMSASSAGAGGVRQTANEMKEQTASVAESAKNMASQAGDKLLSTMEQQKTAGADFVSGMAGAMRRAANEFGDVPQAAQYIHLAADQIDSVSDAFRRRDLNQLVAEVQDFARRQPTAFMGAAVLAGFAVMRFLKTSTAGSAATSGQSYGTGSNWPSRGTGMSLKSSVRRS